jgi:hypothetical protein
VLAFVVCVTNFAPGQVGVDVAAAIIVLLAFGAVWPALPWTAGGSAKPNGTC